MRSPLLLLAGLLVLAGCSSAGGVVPAAEAPPVNGLPVTAQVADPVSIAIPKLAVADEVVPVGLDSQGALEVPLVTEVGYYTGLPKPGENGNGPALLAGHVNFAGKVGPFARIGELAAGDQVTVTDAAGVAHVFAVYAVVEFPKTQYGARIAGLLADTATPEIRMVTCSGSVHNHEYSDNTVVSARLAT